MILRRLATAITRQDWFAVTIELVIVVVGIVLGIEVADWNENRKLQAEEQVYLGRFHQDVRRSLENLTGERDAMDSWRERALATLGALMRNDPESVMDSGFELRASTRVTIASTQMATMNEMISGGRLNDISDEELKRAISRLDAELKKNYDHIQILVDYASQIAPVIQQELRPSLNTGNWRSVEYDFDELAANSRFQNLLGMSLRLQATNVAWMDNMIEELQQMDALLERKLNRN